MVLPAKPERELFNKVVWILRKEFRARSVIQKFRGAYWVRYLFVIYAFSLAETENRGKPFLLGRAPKADHLDLFDLRLKCRAEPDAMAVLLGLCTVVC